MFKGDTTYGHHVTTDEWRKDHGRLPFKFLIRKLFVAPVLMAVMRDLHADRRYNDNLAKYAVEKSASPKLTNLLLGVRNGHYKGERNGLTHERRRATGLLLAAAVATTGVVTIKDGHLPFTGSSSPAAVATLEAGSPAFDGVIGSGVANGNAKKETLATAFSVPAGKISCGATVEMGVEQADVATGAGPLLSRMSTVSGEAFTRLPADSQASFVTQVLNSKVLNPGSYATAIADPNSLPGKTILVPTDCTGAGL